MTGTVLLSGADGAHSATLASTPKLSDAPGDSPRPPLSAALPREDPFGMFSHRSSVPEMDWGLGERGNDQKSEGSGLMDRDMALW